MILLASVVSDFTGRFLQLERANIIQLATFLSFLVALLMVPKLIKMLQRGDGQFNPALWRWCLGLMFALIFPTFLSLIILKNPVSTVIASTPLVPVLDESRGYVLASKAAEWNAFKDTEKSKIPARFNGKFEDSYLSGTIINKSADPQKYLRFDQYVPSPVKQ